MSCQVRVREGGEEGLKLSTVSSYPDLFLSEDGDFRAYLRVIGHMVKHFFKSQVQSLTLALRKVFPRFRGAVSGAGLVGGQYSRRMVMVSELHMP